MDQTWMVILGVLAVMLGGTAACDVAAVNSCIALLNSSQVGALQALQEGIAAVPTADQLRHMCSNMSEFKACYEPAAALCETDVIFSMTFGTIENTVDYLCTEGYDDILRHDSCWSQTQVAADTNMCHVQQTQMLKSLQELGAELNSTNLRTVWCTILDNTTSCMTAAVTRSCQPEARCIMATMMTRSLAGLADFMSCPTVPTGCPPPATTISPPGGSTPTTSHPGQTGSDVTTRRSSPTTDSDKSAFRSTGAPATHSRGDTLLLAFVLAFLNYSR